MDNFNCSVYPRWWLPRDLLISASVSFVSHLVLVFDGSFEPLLDCQCSDSPKVPNRPGRLAKFEKSWLQSSFAHLFHHPAHLVQPCPCTSPPTSSRSPPGSTICIDALPPALPLSSWASPVVPPPHFWPICPQTSKAAPSMRSITAASSVMNTPPRGAATRVSLACVICLFILPNDGFVLAVSWLG